MIIHVKLESYQIQSKSQEPKRYLLELISQIMTFYELILIKITFEIFGGNFDTDHVNNFRKHRNISKNIERSLTFFYLIISFSTFFFNKCVSTLSYRKRRST